MPLSLKTIAGVFSKANEDRGFWELCGYRFRSQVIKALTLLYNCTKANMALDNSVPPVLTFWLASLKGSHQKIAKKMSQSCQKLIKNLTLSRWPRLETLDCNLESFQTQTFGISLLAARDQSERTNKIAVFSTIAAKTAHWTTSELSVVYKLWVRGVEVQGLQVTVMTLETFWAGAICKDTVLPSWPLCGKTMKLNQYDARVFGCTRARLALVIQNCTRQMIFLWKWSAGNLPEIKTLRKIAKTGSKPCKKHSPLSQTFARWPILIFFLFLPILIFFRSTALGVPF